MFQNIRVLLFKYKEVYSVSLNILFCDNILNYLHKLHIIHAIYLNSTLNTRFQKNNLHLKIFFDTHTLT